MALYSLKQSEIVKRLANGAVDFHCHGIDKYDFTDINNISLFEIEKILAKRNQKAILTLYLFEKKFDSFLQFMQDFAAAKKVGKIKYIAGIGLEGPLLDSHGGTPKTTVWHPNVAQWQQLSCCGKQGLIYVILSPDVILDPNNPNGAKNVVSIAEILLEGGVLPAPGHFLKDNPLQSAKALSSLFDVVAAWGQGATITDHLFNDMPLNFRHAWRTPADIKNKANQIKELDIPSWSLNNIESKLGPVPATMVRYARKGHVKIAQNFDGEHVDLAVVKKAIDLVGSENMLMMTDSIESRLLAGRKLTQQEGSGLLYQDEGIVAAGSQGIARQIANMIDIGLSEHQIKQITSTVPESILSQHNRVANVEVSCV